METGADPVEKAERRRPHFDHENAVRAAGGARLIAGVDEAGRGPLAGPVVAAAVILPEDFSHGRLDDSKKLTPKRRESIYRELTGNEAVTWACAAIDSSMIDRINILRAANEAMRRAVLALARRPDHALVDGLPIYPFPLPHTAIVEGDAKSLSIAAASVIAKVTRDRIMEELDRQYPAYGFAQHKGYATSSHLAILASHGPCPIHRFTFRPVGQPLFPVLANAALGTAAAAAATLAAAAHGLGSCWDGAARKSPPTSCAAKATRCFIGTTAHRRAARWTSLAGTETSWSLSRSRPEPSPPTRRHGPLTR